MTAKKTTKDQLYTYLAGWLERLSLLHWRLSVAFDKGPLETSDGTKADAKINIDADYNVATIKLDADWPTWKIERLQHVLLHELLHCCLEPTYNAAQEAKSELGETAAVLWENRLLHELELAVDSLAHTLIINWGLVPEEE